MKYYKLTILLTMLFSMAGVRVFAAEIGGVYYYISGENAIVTHHEMAEWNTDISIVAKDGDQTVLGTATIADVPLKAGRITEYSGSLFSSAGSTTISLNDTWATSVTGTW